MKNEDEKDYMSHEKKLVEKQRKTFFLLLQLSRKFHEKKLLGFEVRESDSENEAKL
jgi:hypothetical protein